MAVTPTATGYHAPLKVDPVEPALGAAAATTDPTDVALLARSIETAHARCEAASGAAATGTQNVGALTASTAGVYSRTSGNTRLTVSAGGVYRVMALVDPQVTGANLIQLRVVRASPPDVLDVRNTNGEYATLSGWARVSAGDSFYVTSDVSCVTEFLIERVGP